MSDETTPPPLRLKARLRAEGESAPTPASETPAASVPPADPTPPPAKLRLKPRLDSAASTAESTPAAANPPVEPEPTPAPKPIRLTPRLVAEPKVQTEPHATVQLPSTPPSATEPAPVNLSAEAAPAAEVIATPPAATEPPKFKFKPKVASPETAATIGDVATPLPPPSPIASPEVAPSAEQPKVSTPPPFPVLQHADAPAKKFPPPPSVPHVKAPTDRPEAVLPDSTPTTKKAPTKLIVLVAGTVVLLAAGYFGYRKVTAVPPPPPPKVAVPAVSVPPKPKPAEPTPVKALNDLAALPAKTIADAKNAIAGRRTNEQDRGDALVTGEEVPEKRAVNAPPPGTIKPAPAAKAPALITSTSQVAPGVTATTVATNVDGDASPAFRSWVAQLKIGGVFHGTPPRAFINGRTYRAGQVIDDAMGITFDHLDSDTKSIVFRDRGGATVSRRY